MNLPTSEFASLLWAQTWQISLMILVVWIASRLFAKNRPHLAHMLWLVVLIKCVTPPLWASPSGVFCWLQPVEPSLIRSAQGDLNSPEIPIHVFSEERPVTDLPLRARVQPTPQVIKSTGNDRLSNSGESDIERSAAASIQSAEKDRSAPGFPTLTTWIVWTWWCGFFGLAAVSFGRWASCIRRMKRHAEPADPALQNHVDLLAQRFRLRTSPQVMVTHDNIGPAVIGLLRSRLLLPQAMVRCRKLSELDPVLAHELIHLRRGDLSIGALQLVVQSLWWFNPLVWWVNRLVVRESERCCDEQVVAELRCSPSVYARSLLDVIELKHLLQPVPVFPGVKPVEVTSKRLERIMSLEHGSRCRAPWWCWLVVIAVALVTLPGSAFLVRAQDERATKAWPQPLPRLPQGSNVPGEFSSDQSTSSTNREKLVLKHYDVDRALDGIESNNKLSRENARNLLLYHLRAVSLPKGENRTASNPRADSPQLDWSDDQLVVRHDRYGQQMVRRVLNTIENHGVVSLVIEAKFFRGPQDTLEGLRHRQGLAENQQLDRPVARRARGPSRPITIEVIDDRQLRALMEQVPDSDRVDVWMLKRLTVADHENASIQHETIQRPFLTGFTPVDERLFQPRIQVIEEGVDLHVRPVYQGQNDVRLDLEVEISKVKSVEESELKTEHGNMILQIPTVANLVVQSSLQVPCGKTVMIGDIQPRDQDGGGEAIVILLCVKRVVMGEDGVGRLVPANSEQPAYNDLIGSPVSRGQAAGRR